MYECTIEKGQMIFKSPKTEYRPSGRTLKDMDEVVSEHNLIVEILGDHAWAFPVIEALQIRKEFLLQNLFNLYKESRNGRNIQNSENNEIASAERGRSSSTYDGSRSNKTEKT
jgi:hypothetical protein